MRNPTVSYHNESTRALPSSIGGSNYTHYRPWLHMRNIINLIQLRSYLTETLDNDASEDPVPVGNGKKRALPPSSSDQRIAKKSKKEPSSSNRSSADKPKNNPYPDLSTSYRYPTLLRVDVEKKSANAVPVHLHVFEIQFTSDIPNRLSVGTFADVHKEDWEAEERWFVQELRNTYGDVNEPLTIDLGEVEISKVPGIPRLAIGTNSLCIDEDVAWLLLLPECNPDRLDVDTLDLHKSSEDLLLAFAALSARKRAKLDVSLKMVLLPEAACDSSKNELPFRFQIQVKISLIIPRIFEPFQDRSNVELDDARRRVLLFLYPLSPPPPSFEGTVNVPFYYSVMKPAPALPTKEIEDSIQPEELVPTLLPFQRRTVAWMLDREGMGLSSDGTVVSKVTTSDFNFWKEVHEGDHTWYLHRLAGLLSPQLPNSESEFSTQGGILAEEPGLGKTVETIALIALNPPSEDRNPSVKSWDPATELEIKAVKSTLIVTPAALATQWQDEFKTHAPHLKVLFYEGWSNVKVPISQSQIEKEKERRAQEKLKARRRAARAKSRAESKKNIAKRGKAYDQPIDLEDSDNDEEDEEIVDWVAFAHSFDVVITTYNVLQGDLNVARAPPTRPRRDGVVYSNLDRPRSPLVMVEWNRVVMDEVQMAGGGKTEDMVSLIPRLTSFAVSGTPARTQVADLIHVLRFLRVNQFIGGQKMWLRLIKPGYASLFANFFGHYSVRTMKSTVNNELTIPQQTRYLVSIEMGRVERHVYDQTLEEVLLLLGLDARGVAASQGWEIDGALLRMSIRKLRGICTHPQVGQLLRTNEKSNKATGTLKSMAEVLEMMKDQNWRNMMDDWKSKAQGLVMIAQLQLMKSRAKNQLNTVLETLTAGEKETLKLRKEIETAIAEHKVKGEALKKEAAALRAERSLGANEGSNDKGKGKERASSPSDIEDEEEEDDDEENEDDRGLPKTPAGREHRDKGRALRQRLREAMIVLHRVKFLQGDVYHNLGPTESANEDKSYGDAELLRRNLLKFTADKAEEIMTQLKQCKRNTTKKGVSEEDLMIPVPYLEQGGIRSADLVTELDAIIEDVLNPQTELLWEWRTKLHALLTTSLNPADNDSADGGEYQRTLDDQGEAEVYLQAYQALIADRREALVNERTLLAAHDDRETKQRKTKAALKAIAAVDDDLMLPLEGEMRPEDEVLQKQLALTRRDLVKDLKGRSVKSILVEHSAALLRITRDSDPEKALIIDNIKEIRTLMSSQQAHLLELDADLVVFRRAFNQRVLYFRQLQEISDSVAEVEFEGTREEALARAQVQQGDFEAKLNTSRARQRYLDHLTMTQDGGEGDDDEKCCILCRCEFDRGYITLCAHIFCEGCMNMWMKKVQGKVCPVCRVPVNVDNLQRFSIHNPEQPPPRIVNGEAVPSSKRKIEYNIIDPKLFEQIQSVESYGDFGVKIQTLVRHLLYLQLTEPGTKSIVFSAWADSLHIVERALRENGIRSLRIDSGGKGKGAANKFKTDPDILVLLLHGERENAGLNVTCASRVFLLESVVHHGFELQAIARVDRMGQTKPTEVYCYYAEDTIERNILDLAAKRGLSLYTKENSTGTVNVSTFVADQEKKVEALAKKNASKTQKGDFISQIDDMLAILFPHMYEDVEYLIPEDTVMGNITNTLENNHHAGETGRLGKRSSGHVEAVAGPSRLH
ncbi:hypothetical protein K435DRAFT_760893 [Dendrothele bispora CBS 962.96]|uniref:RING-type domain-containing protein n=1 Tax=Dendrothele bispora (strain CBS 962.96) TaxID=1314807 RepID=A0A4S8LKB8_DENBC|nr:hypothetical protein K435DRAFT_760893 [Dendrothele bispora CBS 962.96]